jgi:hypothetical protein
MNKRGSLSVCRISYPQKLADTLLGAVSEQLNDTDRANSAYENALRHNPLSVSALTQVAGIARVKEDFHKVSRICDILGAMLIFSRPSTTTNEYSTSRRRMAKSGDLWVIVT